MIISSETINSVFHSFNTVFNMAFAAAEVRYLKVAMEVPSETRDETYAWLGATPSMREWISEREIKNLATYDYTIKNRDFELTVSVPRNDIEDDRIGVYKPIMQDLAYSAKLHPDKLVFELFPKAFTEKCFDGKPFISDQHKPLYSNAKIAEQSNKGTSKLTPDSYGAARSQMMTLMNDEGEPLYIIPDLLVVAPQNEAVARKILMADEIQQGTNIYKDTAELLVVPELATHPAQWFLLCTKRPIKPFIFQNRRKPQLVPKDNPSDDNVFFQKEYIYGVDSRCNAGYGLWQLAFGSTGEE
ncbi:MAG TPA: head protein [Ruminiclostridium sp.]|jgi:phage major head subunit gpT-like protein|nr:head protein [Bacillota bacterium]HBR04047.1 head protein [Ruminiclostridium sp.]